MSATHRAAVLARRHLTPRTVRITLAGPSLLGLAPRPAQDIEVLLADADGARVRRRYTIRHARPQTGEWDIDAVLHAGGGPGSTWAAGAGPGTPVEFAGPRGKLALRPAAHHLFVGDEASLPAIAALAEALPAGEAATAVIETGSRADRVPVAAGTVRWLERGSRPPGTAQALLAAVGQVVEEQGGAVADGQLYVLAESRTARAVRELAHRAGFAAGRVFAKGYWTAGHHTTAGPRAAR